jgi:hypothetical protein
MDETELNKLYVRGCEALDQEDLAGSHRVAQRLGKLGTSGC